eukprot:4434429-Pyramimonas_sp.AAC.1
MPLCSAPDASADEIHSLSSERECRRALLAARFAARCATSKKLSRLLPGKKKLLHKKVTQCSQSSQSLDGRAA